MATDVQDRLPGTLTNNFERACLEPQSSERRPIEPNAFFPFHISKEVAIEKTKGRRIALFVDVRSAALHRAHSWNGEW